MKTPQPNAMLLAVADVIHDERLQRTAADRELKADIARARERIDEYGNVIETRFMALDHRMRELVGELVAAIEVKDGIDGAPGPAGPIGERGEPGPIGQPGPQGERGDTGSIGPLGERGETGERGERGEAGPEGPKAYPGQARGLYQADGAYLAMDVVVMNGCEWRAIVDNPGPLPGDDWMQGAKQGRKGDKGERGAQGAIGMPGPAGAGIVDIEIKDFAFVVLLSDGRKITRDVRPWFERYHEEAAA